MPMIERKYPKKKAAGNAQLSLYLALLSKDGSELDVKGYKRKFLSLRPVGGCVFANDVEVVFRPTSHWPDIDCVALSAFPEGADFVSMGPVHRDRDTTLMRRYELVFKAGKIKVTLRPEM